MVKHQLFKVRTLRARRPKGVIFYLTSYRASWLMYLLPILRLRLKGLTVIVYDFDDKVIDNDNPKILVNTVEQVCSNIYEHVQTYNKQDVRILGGIGNSLGSYFMYNYCYRYPLDRVMLNSVGAIEITIFEAITSHFRDVKDRYIRSGYTRHKVHMLWKKVDREEFGKKLKVKRALVTVSNNDQVVPTLTTNRTVKFIELGDFETKIVRDNRRHSWSVIYHSHSMRRIFRFFEV